ncbi:MAG: DedA family protein [Dehalococcoidales bacterium]|jgi:membrane protein DedA with SNARE-associated domain
MIVKLTTPSGLTLAVSVCYTPLVASIEHWLLDVISSTYNLLQWPGVIALMAIESACIPFPSEIIMPLAGWMLIKDLARPVSFVLLAGVFGAIGNTIGSVIAYYVGMWAGRPLLNKYGKYVLLSQHDLDIADRWFSRSGGWTVFVSRLLPVVRTYISLPAGIARMHIGKFLVYTFIGSFIWSTALAYGGYLLGEHWESLRNAMRPFDPIFIAIIVILLGLYVYRHIRHTRRDNSPQQ